MPARFTKASQRTPASSLLNEKRMYFLWYELDRAYQFRLHSQSGECLKLRKQRRKPERMTAAQEAVVDALSNPKGKRRDVENELGWELLFQELSPTVAVFLRLVTFPQHPISIRRLETYSVQIMTFTVTHAMFSRGPPQNRIHSSGSNPQRILSLPPLPLVFTPFKQKLQTWCFENLVTRYTAICNLY